MLLFNKYFQRGISLIETAIFFGLLSLVINTSLQVINDTLHDAYVSSSAMRFNEISDALKSYMSKNRNYLLNNVLKYKIIELEDLNLHDSVKNDCVGGLCIRAGVLKRETLEREPRLLGIVFTYPQSASVSPVVDAKDMSLYINRSIGDDFKDKNLFNGFGWSISKSDYPDLFDVLKHVDSVNVAQLFTNDREYVDYYFNSTTKTDDINVNVKTLTSTHKVDIDNYRGGEWIPLFDSDVMSVSWTKYARSKIEMVDIDGRVLYSDIVNGMSVDINPSTKLYDKKVKLKITPLDDNGESIFTHQFPEKSNSYILIKKYSGNPWSDINIVYSINVYNHDLSIPDKPKNGTRTSLGMCATKGLIGQDTLLGLDILSMELKVRTPPPLGARFLDEQTISFSSSNGASLFPEIKFTVSRNAVHDSEAKFFIQSFDQRHKQFMINNNIFSNEAKGFVTLKNKCLSTDTGRIFIHIKANEKQVGSIEEKWFGGAGSWNSRKFILRDR